MSIVNPNVGAGIGNLLRSAEERDQQNQLLNKPAALPTSPLRQLVRTTMLSPLSPGSARIVGVNPEPMIPTEVQPSVGMNAAMGQGVAPRAPEPAGAVPGIAQPSAPTMGGGGAVPQGSIAQGQPANVLGPRAVRPSTINAAPSSMGNKWATPLEAMQVQVPAGRSSFPSEQAFQQAQTPTQNILGGIGKVGTAVTSALFGPTNKSTQLLPGGAFQQLQNKMAPLLKRLMPNFNKNKA